MTLRKKLSKYYSIIDTKFTEQFGFKSNDASLSNLANYLFLPKDSSSLAVTRILFGLAMLFDIPDERGGALMNKRWGDPNICHFPLFPFIQAVPMPYMAFVYAAMWIGALGVMLGYKYRLTAPLYTVCHWYLLLIEKSYWNNHSYLFGLVALLLSCTEANCYWSLDAHLNPSMKRSTVPYWNYFVLKYQFFILYFMAGMKKGTAEWLTGYSVQNLSEHWVFTPFTLILTVPQTDYFIVHWFIFVFDLTIAIWMMLARTRLVAMALCALFHLMNSRLFAIGMFPWVCLATMPLFYPFDWPKQVMHHYRIWSRNVKDIVYEKMNKKTYGSNTQDRNDNEAPNSTNSNNKDEIDKNVTDGYQEDSNNADKTNNEDIEGTVVKSDFNEKSNEGELECHPKETKCDDNKDETNHKKTVYLILFYIIIQLFLPYSHFITKGYNNWTNGLYGYSWDMMVHTWDIQSVVVKIVDNNNNKELYIDPYTYAPNDRWTRHGDMIHQYAECLKQKLLNPRTAEKKIVSENISIYIDVWCSMNSRFIQRMFDPNVDILKANWSPFQTTIYLMPLLDESLVWRDRLEIIRKDVYSWNNYSDVLFFADFPGYYQEKYIPEDLYNVTLTVLEGSVAFEPEVTLVLNGQSYQLSNEDHVAVKPGGFHKVLNIGNIPAFYMYTLMNSSNTHNIQKTKPKLPIFGELHRIFKGMVIFCNLILDNVIEFIFTDPLINVNKFFKSA